MLHYIGTKRIKASPMKLGIYNQYRGWDLPANEDPNTDGMLVEYLDGGTPNHESHENYISWSPTDVFNQSYKPTVGMSFGFAIDAMRLEQKVARSGWNGKGMYLYLVPENRYAPTTEAGQAIADNHPDGLVPYGAYIAMKTAQDNVVPWLASQTDVLAMDWEIVE